MISDNKWLDEEVTLKYKDIFTLIVENPLLKETLNESKLAEIAFSSMQSLYAKINNISPYSKNMEKCIKYVKGDATEPIGNGKKIIVHICNDIGGWGRGFVLALSKKWKEPEKCYRESYRKLSLGDIQYVKVEEDITVCNMVAQHGCYPQKDLETGEILPPIRYNALKECLIKVAIFAKDNGCSVHMPKIGAGLAGGDWRIIEDIINNTLIKEGIETIVYLFDEEN